MADGGRVIPSLLRRPAGARGAPRRAGDHRAVKQLSCARHLRLAGTAATAAEPPHACLLGSTAAAVRGRSCRPLPVPPAFPDDPVAGAEPVLRGTGRAWRARPDA